MPESNSAKLPAGSDTQMASAKQVSLKTISKQMVFAMRFSKPQLSETDLRSSETADEQVIGSCLQTVKKN
jgi:hypothetical protein